MKSWSLCLYMGNTLFCEHTSKNVIHKDKENEGKLCNTGKGVLLWKINF